MRLLHVVADPIPTEEAVDRQLAAAFLDALRAADPAARVEEIDLYADPPPYFDYALYRFLWRPLGDPGYAPSAEETAAGRYATRHAAKMREADVLLLTAPMWNYSVPGILKSWIDQVICPGGTYRLGPQGPEPIHAVKRVVLFTASGGRYGPDDRRDCLTNLVRAAFGFLAVRDVDVVWADGQNRHQFPDAAERREAALDRARSLARSLAAP